MKRGGYCRWRKFIDIDSFSFRVFVLNVVYTVKEEKTLNFDQSVHSTRCKKSFFRSG